MPDKLWYEQPIKIVNSMASPGRSWAVANGFMAGNQLPTRHVWWSHEEQQAACKEMMEMSRGEG